MFSALMEIGRRAWRLSVSYINKDKGTALHRLGTSKYVSSALRLKERIM